METQDQRRDLGRGDTAVISEPVRTGARRTRNVVTTVLTERRVDLLRAIAAFVQAHRYAPSLRQLASPIDVKSHSNVHAHLVVLRREGFVTFDRDNKGHMVTRTLALTEKGREAVEL